MSRALAILGVVALTCVARAQEPTFPSNDVRINVRVDESGTATVVEEYRLLRPVERVNLEMRGDRCARVGPILATLGDSTLTFEEAQRGPWTLLREVGHHQPQPYATTVRVRYDVALGAADATLPIVLPAARLDRVDGARGANVLITVTFPNDLDRTAVLFPRLDRVPASAVWRGQLLAVPSLLRLRGPWTGPTRCAPETSAVTGGLEWRFWLFTGIMVVWVPVYLWVFGRRSNPSIHLG